MIDMARTLTKEQAAKELAKELSVYDRWNDIERYFYLLSGSKPYIL